MFTATRQTCEVWLCDMNKISETAAKWIDWLLFSPGQKIFHDLYSGLYSKDIYRSHF